MGLWGTLFSVAVVGFSIWFAAQMRTIWVEQDYPPEGEMIDVDGHPVHVVQAGSGPDVVILHGSMGSTRDASFRLMPALVEAGFRVTAFDRPGLGYTPRLDTAGVTVSDQVDLLVQAASEIDVENPIVAGQSYGGALAANWALRHPDQLSGLVSIAGATHTWTGPLDLSYRVLSWPIIGPVVAHGVSAIMSDTRLRSMVAAVFRPDEMPGGFIDHFGPRLNLAPHRLVANAQQRTDLRAQLAEQESRYDEISVPVEIVHGEADTIVGVEVHAEKFVDQVQNGQLTRIPDAGHMLHHTHTGDIVAAVTSVAQRAGIPRAD